MCGARRDERTETRCTGSRDENPTCDPRRVSGTQLSLPYASLDSDVSVPGMAIQSASRLRSVLARVLRQDTTITGYDEQEVLEELSLHKQLLLRLLDVGGRDAGERREVESGMYCYVISSNTVNS